MSDYPRSEYIVRRILELVRRWGDPGTDALIGLMDDDVVDDHSAFCEEVARRCVRDPAYRSRIEGRAREGGRTSLRIVEHLRDEASRQDLDGLLVTLVDSILPSDWAALTARTPAEAVRTWRAAWQPKDPTLRSILDADPGRLYERLESWGFTGAERDRLDRWFANFTGVHERQLATKLLWSVDYYSAPRFEDTLRLRHEALLRAAMQRDHNRDQIVLVTPGGIDSAQRHAYDIAKTWGLAADQVRELHRMSTTDARDRVLVWFNDTHGTGGQFLREVWPRLAPIAQAASAFALVAIAVAAKARDRFQAEIPEAIIIPDYDARAAQKVLTADELRCASDVGRRVYPPHPLGYGGTALLVAYYFQCPNNSLPVLWADSTNNSSRGQAYPWRPLEPYRPKVRRLSRDT